MKNFVIILLSTFVMFSCKEPVVEAPLVDRITGLYVGSSVNISGTKLSLPYEDTNSKLSIDFDLLKIDKESLKVVFRFVESVKGKENITTENFDALKLNQNADGSFSLKTKDIELINIIGKKMIFTQTKNGLVTKIEALKK